MELKGINKVHHMNFLNNDLPDKCANLLISDPPYFEVKGAFDFIWNSFDDYLKDVEKWAIECKRILADNGTLFWYGDNKKIAYTQIILDKYFKLINNLRWKKNEGGLYGTSGSDMMRSFPPCSETILMYSNFVKANKNIYQPIMNYIKTERLKCGWNYSQMDNFIGIKASSCFWDKETSHEFVIPTKENWTKLQETGNFKKEYEDLKREYEDLRRPFNNMGFLDSFTLLQEFTKNNNYAHDTVKPEKLTRALILTCSRKNDLVVVPFAGSGTECASAFIENRNFIGFDIDEKYVKMSNKRCKLVINQSSLFH